MKRDSRIARKAALFTESVIREMTRLAQQYDAINLAQGFPNFPAPQFIKDAACRAIQDDINQYAITWGASSLRNSIAEKYQRVYGLSVNPETEITVCCGATESMISSILALVNPGDRVLVFEPFYENYGPDSIIAGANPVFFPMTSDAGWSFDPQRLEATIQKTEGDGGIRAMILNTPNNPTGKVFTDDELNCLAELAERYDFYVLTDEIYEHITFDGHGHRPIASLPRMRNRTVTISGLSKTFSVTGWRLGYVLAPPDLSSAIRKMHDFISVGAAAPLQEAAAEALGVPEEFYQDLSAMYQEKRDLILEILEAAKLRPWKPDGAYYVMADISELTEESSVEFSLRLVKDYGVAVVPGSSFYHDPDLGAHLIRFTVCKTMDVLEGAGERLLRLSQ